MLPTDEYTPGDADNDVQRTDNPGYWLVTDHDPNQPASGTIQNPNETIANYDEPIPFSQTVATRAPQHLVLSLRTPQILILNLRDFPAWHVLLNGTPMRKREHRDDGLLALPLPSGSSVVDVKWERSWDQNLGTSISLCALLVLGGLLMRSRKIET